MTAGSNRVTHPSRRAVMAGGAAALGANLLAQPAAALTKTAGQPPVAPDRPPDGYNILFILVDQEHFFDPWPFPVPGREWIRQNGITFSTCRSVRPSMRFTMSGRTCATKLAPPDCSAARRAFASGTAL